MSRRLSVALVVIASLYVSLPGFTADTPHPAPDFALAEVNGHLSDLQGKVVYVDFWASWCGPCRKSFPWLNEMAAKYRDEGLVVLSINVDSNRQDAEKFLQEVPAEFGVTFDPEGKIAELYRVMGMPSAYLIDRQGQIRESHIGFRAKEMAHYEEQIRALIAERAL